MDSKIRIPQSFETMRVKGEPAHPEDAGEIFSAYAQDPEVTRFLSWKPHRSFSETLSFLHWCRWQWVERQSYPYLLRLKPQERAIGMIHLRPRDCRIEFGYVLARAYWGQGLMPEVLGFLVDWALRQEEIARAWACCDVENVASARVLEKAGLAREGILRCWYRAPNLQDSPRDCYVYARTRS